MDPGLGLGVESEAVTVVGYTVGGGVGGGGVVGGGGRGGQLLRPCHSASSPLSLSLPCLLFFWGILPPFILFIISSSMRQCYLFLVFLLMFHCFLCIANFFPDLVFLIPPSLVFHLLATRAKLTNQAGPPRSPLAQGNRILPLLMQHRRTRWAGDFCRHCR